MKCHSDENLVKLFECLSNSSRRQILCELMETSNNLFVNHLENNLTIKKNLKKLGELNLIKQISDKSYRLTAVGDLVVECIKGFEFLEKNKEFFADHEFGDVSHDLFKKIGNLTNSQFFLGVHLIFPRWSKMVSESQKFVNCIFSKPPILVADFLRPKINTGLKSNLLFDKRCKIPDCNEFVRNLNLKEHIRNENLMIRMADDSKINLIMSEKQACIFFPDKSGFANLNGSFIGTDPEFVAWCNEYFECKWNDAESLHKLR